MACVCGMLNCAAKQRLQWGVKTSGMRMLTAKGQIFEVAVTGVQVKL